MSLGRLRRPGRVFARARGRDRRGPWRMAKRNRPACCQCQLGRARTADDIVLYEVDGRKLHCGEAPTGSIMKAKPSLLRSPSVAVAASGRRLQWARPPMAPDPMPIRIDCALLSRPGPKKAGTNAVEFGTWVRTREVLTLALGTHHRRQLERRALGAGGSANYLRARATAGCDWGFSPSAG